MCDAVEILALTWLIPTNFFHYNSVCALVVKTTNTFFIDQSSSCTPRLLLEGGAHSCLSAQKFLSFLRFILHYCSPDTYFIALHVFFCFAVAEKFLLSDSCSTIPNFYGTEKTLDLCSWSLLKECFRFLPISIYFHIYKTNGDTVAHFSLQISITIQHYILWH